MGIRSTSKAIIIKDGRVLLNKCSDKANGDYYALPGGGQRQYETVSDALNRECLEETGYAVKIIRFAALCEEICANEGFRTNYPEYSHKMFHVFICEPASEDRKTPTETDDMQVGVEWVEIDALSGYRILPKSLGDNFRSVLDGTAPIFLGSEHVDNNHG
jgi:ADP-ribose pyrophosphatase YjhB (NUDIX family)